MPRDPVAKALKHHAYLWTIYGPVIDKSPIESHASAFLARAKNELDAQTIAATLRDKRYEVIGPEKKLWPPFRRWSIYALTGSMPISRESTEQWVRSTATLLDQVNGVLVHWAPAEKPAA